MTIQRNAILSIRDIREKISKELQIKYLSDVPDESDSNINGIVYGLNYRLFCSTTVKYDKKIKEDSNINGIVYGLNYRLFCSTTVKYDKKIKVVPFLVDTRSKMTYLSVEVLDAFGLH